MSVGLQGRAWALCRPFIGAVAGAGIGGALLQGALAVDMNGPAVVIALAVILGFVFMSDRSTDAQAEHRFGYANGVTLARGVLIALLAGLAGSTLPDRAAWLAAGLAVICLALDGLDGWIARRWNHTSHFGARFDMESDALLMLVLCIVLVMAGKAPFWTLGIGLMRYGFLAWASLLPALQAPLPESFRRKTICVVQGLVLTVCLTPLISAAVAGLLLALALASLTASFAIDCHWLLSRPTFTEPSKQQPGKTALEVD